ncbi:hypothetical protein [Dickeya sp. NCPPB 3274]|uniref:hypothetical protein n=1 Tax=Dickeya sp. NCPPB 3274 TaxID=568766 RepID=UPI001267D7C7|nr:hypothetical protein [Dickeya sp. NCPPB 3274]
MKKDQFRGSLQRKITAKNQAEARSLRSAYCACCTMVKLKKLAAAVNNKAHDNPPLPQNGEVMLNKSTDIVRSGKAKNRGGQGVRRAGFSTVCGALKPRVGDSGARFFQRA